LNDATGHDGARYVFRATEDEGMAFRRFLIRKQKRFFRRSLTTGIPLLSLAALMIPMGVAYGRGWLSISALYFAELGFVAGYLGLLIGMVSTSRYLYRDLFRHTRSAQVDFDCTFRDTGLVVKKGTLESTMTWDAISDVQNEGPITAFFYDPTQGFFIPARLFGDAAARSSFAAWASEHVRAAQPTPLEEPVIGRASARPIDSRR
jgi:hypothetical protein